MIPLTIHMTGDGAFENRPRLVLEAGRFSDIAYLENGTTSGGASIAVVVTTPDGTEHLGETTWLLLYNAVKAFEARYGTPF